MNQLTEKFDNFYIVISLGKNPAPPSQTWVYHQREKCFISSRFMQPNRIKIHILFGPSVAGSLFNIPNCDLLA